MHRLRLPFLGAGLILGLAASSLPALAQIEYEYDALGRLVSEIHPDGKQTIYSYDPAGNRTAKTIHLTVQNHVPEPADDAFAMNEATAGEWDPRGNDVDDDSNPLTVTSVLQGENGAVQITQAGTHVQYVPAIGFIGEDHFTYTVDDGQGGLGTASVTVTVNNVPPTANADSVSLNENASLTFDPRVNDSDPTGQPVTVTAVTTPANGTAVIVNNGTQIQYTPNATWFGTDNFSYTITGYHNDTANGAVTATVNSTNQVPDAVDDAIQVQAGNALTFDPRTNDSDPDSDPITITAKTDGTQGTVAVINGGTQLTYTANPGASGSDSFTYTIEDPEAASDTATVNVTFVGNQPPDAVDDGVFWWNESSTYVFDPRINDSDPDQDPLEIIAVTSGQFVSTQIINNGTQIRVTTGSVVENWPGSFTYTISDGAGGTDTATVNYIVKNTGGGPPQ